MIRTYLVKARYLNVTISFEIEAETLAFAIPLAESVAKDIFRGAQKDTRFWANESHIEVKESGIASLKTQVFGAEKKDA
jgi:hypothetical protein